VRFVCASCAVPCALELVKDVFDAPLDFLDTHPVLVHLLLAQLLHRLHLGRCRVTRLVEQIVALHELLAQALLGRLQQADSARQIAHSEVTPVATQHTTDQTTPPDHTTTSPRPMARVSRTHTRRNWHAQNCRRAWRPARRPRHACGDRVKD
jgi:hypothetical protein